MIGCRFLHILFITDNFPPEVNAPASRTYEHVLEWVKLGHQVTVITGVPNFPHGKVYSGYKNKILATENVDGIRVVRVWTYIAANKGFSIRIVDYISFMITSFLASFLVRRVDIIVGTSPQFFTVVSAWMVAGFKSKPFVFELRDIWPESIKAVGVMKNSLMVKLLEKFELFLYRRADAIISVTNSFKQNLIDRKIPSRKIHVITNGVDTSTFRNAPKPPKLLKKYKLEGKFVVGYIGTHGLAHALETILDAANQMQMNSSSKDVHFLFIGDGALKSQLLETASEMKLDNVTFLDSVEKKEVSQHWSLLDVSVVHLKRAKLFQSVIPSKIFECMATGVPILLGVEGESAAIVKKTQTGLLFEPENAGDLVSKIRLISADDALKFKLRENCIRTAAHFNRKKLAKDMMVVLKKLKENSR